MSNINVKKETEGDGTADERPGAKEVMEYFFAYNQNQENYEWVLFENGTYYLWPKKEGETHDPDDLIEDALKLSREAHLIQYKNNDDVGCIELTEYGHPTYIVMSCLRYKIGWVIIGHTKEWASNDSQKAAICYLARQRYELDCEQNHIIATSFPFDLEKLKNETEGKEKEEK